MVDFDANLFDSRKGEGSKFQSEDLLINPSIVHHTILEKEALEYLLGTSH